MSNQNNLVYLIRTYRNIPGLQLSQPMGIMYLAAYIREKLAVEVRLIDMRLDKLTPTQILTILRANPPAVVGISALSFEAPAVHELAEAVKKEFKSVPIVIGGPYATTLPELVMRDENIDCAVIGEGEETFREYLEQYFHGEEHPRVAGTMVRSEGQAQRMEERPYIQDLDVLPLPAWDLLDIRRYFGLTNFNRVYAYRENMTIMTSRGCPFRCAYCHNVFGLKFRARSPVHVLDEIKALNRQFGVREYLIVDDTFNLNRPRAKEICNGIIDIGIPLKFSFPNGLKADVMDDELIELLGKCGTYRICYGVESASPRILELITRKIDLEKTREVIAKTARESILTHGFFMIGFPTETEEEMHKTIQYAINSKLHTASFFIVVPFPGTRLYDLASSGHQQSYIDGVYHHIENVISAAPPERVSKIVKKAYRTFYFNPRRMYHILKLTPFNMEFIRGSLEFFTRAK